MSGSLPRGPEDIDAARAATDRPRAPRSIVAKVPTFVEYAINALRGLDNLVPLPEDATEQMHADYDQMVRRGYELIELIAERSVHALMDARAGELL